MSTQEGTLPKPNAPVEGNSAKDGHVKLSWRERFVMGLVTLAMVLCLTSGRLI